MKSKIPMTRPNRKVTEFFIKKPKTGPRPGQPVHCVASSSDSSVMSVKVEDVPLNSGSGPSTRVVQSPYPRMALGTRSSPLYISSSSGPSDNPSTPDRTVASSPGPIMHGSAYPEGKIDVFAPSQELPLKSNGNPKKRKQPHIHVISSDESDPVLPVRRAKPPSRNGVLSPGSRSHSRRSVNVSMGGKPVLLSPRENTLSPSRFSSVKLDTADTASDNSVAIPRIQSPSPTSVLQDSGMDTFTPSAPCDADDEEENEDHPTTLLARQNLNISTNIPSESTDVDVSIPASSPLTAVSMEADEMDVDGAGLIFNQPREKTLSHTDPHDGLSGGRRDELALGADKNTMDVDAVNDCERESRAKSLVEAAISRAKAKAEEVAAEQAQLEMNESAVLLDNAENLSDFSSLSSLSDSDGGELEFDLDAFGAGSRRSSIKRSSPLSISNETNVSKRRSARNETKPAINYGKKLKLFRDDSPLSLSRRKEIRPDGKFKVQQNNYSPLDALLKDYERERTRTANAEKKRKRLLSSPHSPSSILRSMHPDDSETYSPKARARSGSSDDDISSSQKSHASQDSLMDNAEREELWGKEDADAIGKILSEDRLKRGQMQKKSQHVFWVRVQEGCTEVVPEFVVEGEGEGSSTLQLLSDKLTHEDYAAVSHLINAGALYSVPNTIRFLKWLFLTAMSTANFTLSTAAFRAVLVLLRDCHETPPEGVQLRSETLIGTLLKFGVNPPISNLLATDTTDRTAVVKVDEETRALMIWRFVNMLEALGRYNGIHIDSIPCTVVAVLLLALDPSTGQNLQQDIVRTIESLLSSPMIPRSAELAVCRSIFQATMSLDFTPQQQVQLLTLLSGSGASSGRVRRWTAWAMLGEDLSSVVECGDVPPINLFTSLFDDNPIGDVRLVVDRETDYDVLGARIEVLSVALSDVDAYVRLERSTPKERGNGQSIDDVCRALERLNGKIVDMRAAHLDRTRTKDAINRLHNRVVYQIYSAVELIRGNAGKMDNFVTKSPNVKSRPKSKPAVAGEWTEVDL